jgi:hypothetical protein
VKPDLASVKPDESQTAIEGGDWDDKKSGNASGVGEGENIPVPEGEGGGDGEGTETAPEEEEKAPDQSGKDSKSKKAK